ncbi:MAG TPA: peptidylprolyl isomerase [Feifaniaceae bacterium]|nr:peptidylprolyl isomerase [Feifaniaceae bacterium]
MKKTAKMLIAAVLALLITASMFGCSLVSVDNEKDRAQVIAKVGDMEVTKGEYMDLFDYYLYIYQMYGQDPTTTADGLNSFQDLIMDAVVSTKATAYQAKLQGYTNLTAEQQAEVDADVQADLDYFKQSAQSQAESEVAEDPSLDVEKRKTELFNEIVEQQYGEKLTEEQLKARLAEEKATNASITAMQDAFNAGVTVTDEEVQAAFDEQLAADKEEITADPSSYKAGQEQFERSGGMPPLYVPAGYVRIKHISVLPEEELGTEYTEIQTAMQDLADELAKLTLEDEAANAARIAEIKAEHAAKKAEAETMRNNLFASVKQKIDEAYAKLQGGASFDDVMKEYTQDPDFTVTEGAENPFYKTGVLLSDASQEYSEQVRGAAKKLTAAGSYSEIVVDDEGYHIVQLVGEEPAGERRLAEYQAQLKESVLTAKQEEEWYTMVEEWARDTTIVTTYPDLIRDVGTAA